MFNTVTLPNKLQIVMETIPFVRSVSFGIWVRTGARNETESENGISHFLEHMMFKGTKTRTAKQIADEFDEIGGQLNAYTSKEITCYYVKVLDTHLDKAINILSDMFFNSNFSDEEITKEKNVILEEINMTEDSPEDLVNEIALASIYEGDPLRLPVLGTKETIMSFDKGTFESYFKNNYCPENTLVAVAGNFKEDELIKKIEGLFSNFKNEKEYKKPGYNAVYKQSIISREKDIEQLHFSLMFPGVSAIGDDNYTMTLFNTFFGGGMSSRLFQNIRETHGLVYSIYSYNTGYIDTGLFSINAATHPSQSEKAIKLILEEIERLHEDRITEDYLQKTKEQLKSNLLLGLESSSSRMSSIGRSMLIQNRILTPDEVIKKIDDVDIKKIYTLIGKVFDKKQMSISTVGKLNEVNL